MGDLGDLKNKNPKVKMLLQVNTCEESWIPLRHALGSTWNEFRTHLQVRIRNAMWWMCEENGPDYTTLFITEHRSDVATLREFKYADIYKEVNKTIITEQLRYCKNPAEYLAQSMHVDGDPLRSEEVAADILYSGDFASAKKDQLLDVYLQIKQKETTARVPASLNFIPDG